jgi:hypothetical protein
VTANLLLQWVVELDESYFGAKRIRGKRGRGAYGKTIVFGIYKRNGSVYTEIVSNCSRQTLYAIIKGKVNLGRKSTPQAAQTLITVFFRSRTTGVRANDGRINQQIFKILVTGNMLKEFFKDTRARPSRKAFVYRVPITVTVWQ